MDTVLKYSIIVAFISFIVEYQFYINVWTSDFLWGYSLTFSLYIIVLSLGLVLNRSLKLQDSSDVNVQKKITWFVYFYSYFITTVVYAVTFLGRSYGLELVLIGAVLMVCTFTLMFTNKEIITYLVFAVILFCDWHFWVIPGEYGKVDDIVYQINNLGRGIGIALILYIAGSLSYRAYYNNILNRYYLEETIQNQKAVMHYLSNEFGLDNDKIDERNISKINAQVNQTAEKIAESKRIADEALQRAHKASQAQKSFISSMNHEIRTPLHITLGMLSELKGEPLNKEQIEYVQICLDATEHLLSIVNNVLDISKLESGEIALARETFSLRDLVEDSVTLMTAKAKNKNVSLSQTIDPGIAPAYLGDEIRLKQVLINLLDNAIKFTHIGSISIKVGLLSVNKKGGHDIQIEVTDTGIGISDKFLTKIFDRFSQESDNKEGEYVGTGLGMAVSKSIVDALGGNIEVDSKEGAGTTVRIIISLQEGNKNQIKTIDEEDMQLYFEGSKVLLVEDNPMNRIIANKILTNAACKVIEAENGQEAIDCLRIESIDIVLMDISMPILNGLEATKIIREDLKLNLPIVAMTANSLETNITEYLESGMDDYISKPYTKTDVLKILDKWVTSIDRIPFV